MIPIPSKLYLYGGLALALALAAWWVYAKGRDAGKQEATAEAVTEAKRQTKEIIDAAEVRWAEQVRASEQEVAEAQKARQASERRESLLVQTLSGLATQRSTVQRDVAKLADTSLHSAIVSSLGVRSESESIPVQACFTFQEERAILQAVTDQPLCQKTVDSLQAQVTEVRGQIDNLRQEVAATAKQVEAERALRQRYAESYTTLWNAVPTKKRSWKCLWMTKCSKLPPLPVPSPEALLKPAS